MVGGGVQKNKGGWVGGGGGAFRQSCPANAEHRARQPRTISSGADSDRLAVTRRGTKCLPPSRRQVAPPGFPNTHTRPPPAPLLHSTKAKVDMSTIPHQLKYKNNQTFTPSHDNSATQRGTNERLARGGNRLRSSAEAPCRQFLANIHTLDVFLKMFTAPEKTTVFCSVHRRRGEGGAGRGGGKEEEKSCSAADTLSRSHNVNVQHFSVGKCCRKK